MLKFTIEKQDNQARLGSIATAHGTVRTPAFLPIGTKGAVKAVTAQELKFWGADMILANTYHLWQRPGDALIRKHGGLHHFMGWDGPILTDSGGFQVFSLGEKRGKVLEVSEKGVTFQSELDGARRVLSPEISIQIQSNLGSDIALVLDHFPGFPFTEETMKRSIDFTLDWAERSLRHFEKITGDGINPEQSLYGILQGGDFPALRKHCASELERLGFAGYAIGGVAVGEPVEAMYRAVELSTPNLPEDKPRHLLGVGTPEQIIGAIARGCDTFDCVLPTRNARHGLLYINGKAGQRAGYQTIRITNEQYKEDFTPPDNTCDCYLCLKHSRAYLRHLFMSQDPLGIRFATMHNLKFYLNLMDRIRRSIQYGSFADSFGEYDYIGEV